MVLRRVTKFQEEIVVFDLETTGFDSVEDDIIQYGLARFVNGEMKETQTNYIYTNKDISPKITSITGITNAQTDKGIPLSEAIDNILNFIEGKVVVCHNAKFDLDFLTVKTQSVGKSLPTIEYDDTLLIARKYFKFQNNKLENLKHVINMGDRQSHDALEDVIVTGNLYYWLFENKEKDFQFKSLKRIDNEINKFLKNGYDFKDGARESMIINFRSELEELDNNYSSQLERELIDKMREYAHNMLASNYLITFPEKNLLIKEIRKGIPPHNVIKYSDEDIWNKVKEVGYVREKETSGYLIPTELKDVIDIYIKKAITNINNDMQNKLKELSNKETDVEGILIEILNEKYPEGETLINKAIEEITSNKLAVTLLKVGNGEAKKEVAEKLVDKYLESIDYSVKNVPMEEVNKSRESRVVLSSYNVKPYINDTLDYNKKPTRYLKELEQNGLLMKISDINKTRKSKLTIKDLNFILYVIIPNMVEIDIPSFMQYGIKGIIDSYYPDYMVDNCITRNKNSLYVARMEKLVNSVQRVEYLNRTGYQVKIHSPKIKNMYTLVIAHPDNKTNYIEVTMNSIIMHYNVNGYSYRKKLVQGDSSTILQLIDNYLYKALFMINNKNKQLNQIVLNEVRDILDLRKK